MIFGDYSPSAEPSIDQQRDALQKGLGRAMQWATNGRLDDAPLLQACQVTQVFDTQCEGSRGAWLWRLVLAVQATDRFRGPILEALHQLSDERSATQLCELAKLYAKADAEREALDSSVDESIAYYLENYGKLLQEWDGILAEKNVKKVVMSNDEIAKFQEIAGAPIQKAWVAEMSAQGLPAQELLDLVNSTLKDYRATH